MGVLLDYGTSKEHHRHGPPFKVLFRVDNQYAECEKQQRQQLLQLFYIFISFLIFLRTSSAWGGGSAARLFIFIFFLVQQTTSGIGHRVK